MADRILEVANPPTVAPVTSTAPTSTTADEMHQLTDTLARLIGTLDATLRQTHHPPQGSYRS